MSELLPSCKHCEHFKEERYVSDGTCRHPKIVRKEHNKGRGYGFINVARGDYGKFTDCGPEGKFFKPSLEHHLEYAISEHYMYAQVPSAFWNNPARWDNIDDPHRQFIWMD